MIISADIIHYAVAAFLFLIGSFCVTSALTPPGDAEAEAKLLGVAVFAIALGFVIGLHP